MRTEDAIVLTPAATGDANLAIAACRAGARGVLDLEYVTNLDHALAALERLSHFGRGPFGLKLGAGSAPLVDRLLGQRPERLRWVLLAGGVHPDVETWVRHFQGQGIEVLFEAISLDEAQRGIALGADGLILKGHEAGGRVGSSTSFVLLQQWLMHRHQIAPTRPVPVFVQGGMGLHTTAACRVVGATGAVFDGQLLLTREASPSAAVQRLLESFDGSETVCLGERLGECYRFYFRPGLCVLEELSRTERQLSESSLSPDERLRQWREAVRQRIGSDPETAAWPLGQDAALARRWAEQYATLADWLRALVREVPNQIDRARRLAPLAEGSRLAQAVGTRYPIFQGPMTRVSDTAAFADAVSQAGALPFLALALMRKAETERLLAETRQRLGSRPWGAGILGFAPPEVRQEQLEAIRAVRPPFALIAGGRPDQARTLETDGIPTYLHVPSPGLLTLFLKDGARRFIFEGRECGGHVGPRSSFVLWELMIDVLQGHIQATGKGDDLHVLFAGGIHDARSAAMVATLSAGLAEQGVAVGVLVGTAYLFTAEAVATGAIVRQYQDEALTCRETVLLETGPGHSIRCAPTPYYEQFEQEKRRLQRAGRSHDEVREALEAMNIGRLRIASKGIDRLPGDQRQFVTLSPEEQRRQGMYMIGQVACLRDRVIRMAELHSDISQGSGRILESAAFSAAVPSAEPSHPSDIAIVGMGSLMPKAGSLRSFWENILAKVDAIVEVPPDRWDWRLYYDPNPKARDKIYSKWGGFIDDTPFDPLAFGMPPNSLTSIEPMQLLTLEVVRQALADAGYADRPFDRERTAVILGAGGGASQLAVLYSFRSYLPMLDTVPGLKEAASEILKKCDTLLPEWTEDSFPGILVNVVAGRVANRFNFGGPSFAVDAACGSSLAALYAAVRELEAGSSDTVVLIGADTVQNPYTYMAFSKTQAFSPRGRCSTFDESADGIVISEGIGVVILKRLADAERDGDRIYAVIKGIGASSDGRDKGLTAPRPEGQLRALGRAYAKAGVSPAEVELVEAHGTGTVVGDQTEIQSLATVFRQAGASRQGCAVGSVKSMIGHTKCAAGLAGLINATLALYHKTLPPTLVHKPNPKARFEESPFYLNTEARPWIHGSDRPRTAAVSAFGFGGTNFHAVLQEYTGDYLRSSEPALQTWPAELCVWRKSSRSALREAVEDCLSALEKGGRPRLSDLAFTLSLEATAADDPCAALAVVANSVDDLRQKLLAASEALRAGKDRWHDPRGVYLQAEPAPCSGKIAFLFPGQGSQYVNMLAQLALVFAEVRQAFDRAEYVLRGRFDKPLGKYIYPPSAFTPEAEAEARRQLTRTDVAQPAIGAASMGLFHLLTRLGIEADYFAGHSYGDYAALCAAGALDEEGLYRLSYQRGRAIVDATDQMPGSMAAVEADAATVAQLIAGLGDVSAANLNSPQQTVISGRQEAVEAALSRLHARGIRASRLPVACAFHSPLVAAAQAPFARALADTRFRPPRKPVYANTTALPYPSDPTALASLLAEHLVLPVRFQAEIEALYQIGVRVFVEVGPQGILTGLVGQILEGQPHLAVATDLKGRPGLVQLQHALAQLSTHGCAVRLGRLFEQRRCRRLDLSRLAQETDQPRLSPSTWLVNGTRARPLHGPEPRILGQAVPRDGSASAAAAAAPPAAAGQGPARQAATAGLARPAAPAATSSAPLAAAGESLGERNGPLPAIPAPPIVQPVAGDDVTQVMLRFQDLMARFLETQRSVMQQFLEGNPPTTPPPVPPPAAEALSGSVNGHAPPGAPPSSPAANAPAPLAPPPDPEPVSKLTALTPSAGPEVPPGTETAAPEPVPTPSAAALDRAAITRHLLDIVGKRTGYPPEMLGLDLDLEADLGIDSIKRVEILGLLGEVLRSSLPSLGGEMEKFTSLKTLRGIIDALVARCVSEPAASSAPRPAAPEADRAGIQRLLPVPTEVAFPSDTTWTPPGGVVLLTDDGRGVADHLARQLADLGQETVLLRPGFFEGNGRDTVYHADLTDADAVEAVLREIRAEFGPITGLIHLLPLAKDTGDSWLERVRREVKSLFLLARGLSGDLRRYVGPGKPLFLAATSMGGQFGSGELPPTFFPGQGGIAGLTKSLAHEWPEVLVRVVDLDGTAPSGRLASQLVAELHDLDGPVEVGHVGDRRVTLRCVPAPLDVTGKPTLQLDSASTIVVTGGARGITAAVALELARRVRPNLVIVGRSAPPPADEAPETRALTEPAELKAALVAQWRAQGRTVTPAAVDAAYHRLLHDREIRANLAAMRAVGAQVHYYQADVRDERTIAGVIEDVERRFGGIDGLVHGAGVIQDKLVHDKTPDSFDRVFGTKVESAWILSRRLRPERLKFCVFFASVAGRFGNRGQSDYAAANEVLSKFAADLDRRWPGRVVAIAWGPWSGIGMVSELEEHLSRRGLRMIPPEVGPIFLMEELWHGRKGQPEVVIAGDVGQLALRGSAPAVAPR
ncbi:MAG: SDR family NAD(P)-dependent oxidoreductase [Gemmataceae bacterium]|nr:SDR family NAD(P)-dependent oxidoreductase [Gemmataceae bacterium]MDW8265368.1 SDR family NAD(P)-dependent oxidoreductase [Gemmataceae bacterium]